MAPHIGPIGRGRSSHSKTSIAAKDRLVFLHRPGVDCLVACQYCAGDPSMIICLLAAAIRNILKRSVV